MTDTIQQLDYSTTALIACATVLEEMLPLLPRGLKYQRMDFGLHAEPDKLRAALQSAIDSVGNLTGTILLGYGLCSRAVVGLMSRHSTLIIPAVDDCIAVFLGSDAEYQDQHRRHPGTLYQTKGWIESDTSFSSSLDMVSKYGEKKARFLLKQMTKNYTRLAFINTGNYEIEHYRTLSRHAAADLELTFEEIPGSNRLVHKLLFGPWDSEFVIVPPGQALTFSDFRCKT